MDNLVFEESINAEIEQSEFVQKKWIYVNDTNSQNYSTQVIVDTTPLANAGGYISWSESYLVIPLVVGLSCSVISKLPTAGLSGAQLDAMLKSVSFKNGFWNLLNSFNIEYNNQTCVQQTAFTNVFRSFKAHTSFSQDDVKNEGPTIGYYPDDAVTWSWDNTAVTGTGVYNADYTKNTGFAKRADWISYSGTAQTGQGILMSVSDSNIQYRSTFFNSNAASGSGKCAWRVYAKLRLKDLADFFGKTPLLKGSTIRLLMNTNQVSSILMTVNSGGTGLNLNTVTGQGYSNPLMIDRAQLFTALSTSGAPSAGTTATVSLAIFKDTANTGIQSELSSVRLYAPVYKMNPIAEQRYLSLAPTKRVSYCDIFQYQFSGLQGNAPFNFLVSNGIPNIKSVLVVPFVSSTSNLQSPHLSPFDSAGATPDPVIISNFNILVSGVNLFLQNQLYDYEAFNHELKSSNQLNGNLTTGLASGQISEQDFSSLYRYYYGNCARVLPSEEGVSRSVQIVGQLRGNPLLTYDLMVFVEFEKTMTIDISTGARIEG